MVDILLRAGVQVNVVDYEGNTPLHNAAKNGNEYYMVVLIVSGADLKARNHKGQTPLELLKLYYLT